MRIGIDIDDTITNTCEFMTKLIASYFNVKIDYLIKNNIFYFNLDTNFGNKAKNFYLSVFENNLLNIPVKKYAKEVINKLKAEGNKIIIITSREDDKYSDPITSTKKQLELYGINYDKLLCTRDKRKACIDENIDIFIDDSIRNTNSVKNIVKDVYLFTTIYNRNFDVPLKRVNDWIQIYELLKNRRDVI